MKFMLFLFFCSFMNYIDASELKHDVALSIQERAVTVKMMEDRLKTAQRRENKIKYQTKHMFFLPEDISDELETLRHDKKVLSYIISSMKEDR